MYYFDTSILVALYVPEAMSKRVQAMPTGARGVAISNLTEVEFHSAISRRVRTTELGSGDAERILSLFRLHIDVPVFKVVPIETRDFLLARDWLSTFQTPLCTLDALHLAAVFSHGYTMVTADKVLADSAMYFGVKCEKLV
jgi:predicted nucleic acid-binding protein